MRFIAYIGLLLLPALVSAQSNRPFESDTATKTVIGPANPDLQEGAQALLAGDAELGVRKTLEGLEVAVGEREHEAALSNLCAGYILLGQYQAALGYCDLLLARNDENWRAYNNRAVIYIKTGQYEKAERDLAKGEALRPGAHTLKVARAMYMDAVHPVAPEVEVDDSQGERGDGQ
ncbi:MAG: tetratricopeptide repeat protein [Woeseiaceae bacterium]|nr:tetratricopeptide repeat protein [Woeseiaceae bacterium]